MNRVKGAFAELGIVILGVMIALAADSWREELSDLSEHLRRIRVAVQIWS